MKIIKKLQLTSTIIAMSLPVVAEAKKPKHSAAPNDYIAAAYSFSGEGELNIGGTKIEEDIDSGSRFDAFFKLDPKWGVYAKYEKVELESDDELKQLDIGLRYFHKYSKRTRLFGGIAYSDNSILDIDDDGFGIHVGAMSAFSKEFSGWVKVDYKQLEDEDEDELTVINLEIGGSYKIDNEFSAYATYSTYDSDYDDLPFIYEVSGNTMSVGISYNME